MSRPIGEVCGILIVLKTALIIERTKLHSAFSKIGRNSYPIYLVHQPYVVPVVVMALLAIKVPASIAFLTAVILGVVIPLGIYKYVFKKSRVLDVLFCGGR